MQALGRESQCCFVGPARTENFVNSDSSCGWTVINREGPGIETVASENGSDHNFLR